MKKNAELIKTIEEIIDFIEKNIKRTDLFLCIIDIDMGTECNFKYDEYLEYLESQKPTTRMNKEFFHHKYFTKGLTWWYYEDYNGTDTNKEKIRFLKHIKAKL